MKKIFLMAIASSIICSAICAETDKSILSFKLVHPDHDKICRLPVSKTDINKKEYELFKKDNENFWVNQKSELNLEDIKDAKLEIAMPPSEEETKRLKENQPNITFISNPSYGVTIYLNEKGTNKFKELTKKNIQRRVAIILNNELIVAPMIVEEIPKGKVELSGISDKKIADGLIDVIKNYNKKN